MFPASTTTLITNLSHCIAQDTSTLTQWKLRTMDRHTYDQSWFKSSFSFRRILNIARSDRKFRHVSLSVCLSLCLFIYLSICLSIHLSVCLSICLSVCLSVLLPSVRLYIWLEQVGCRWTDFDEIWYLNFFRNCGGNSSFIKIWQE